MTRVQQAPSGGGRVSMSAAMISVPETLKAARAAVTAKDYERAEVLLRQALEVVPDNLPALDLLGFVLYFSGRPEEGEEACRRALEVNPDHAYAHKGLGLNLAKRGGDLDEAIGHIRRAIELKPDWFDPNWDLVVTLAEAGRIEAAQTELERARQFFPDYGRRWAAMAAELERRGKAR